VSKHAETACLEASPAVTCEIQHVMLGLSGLRTKISDVWYERYAPSIWTTSYKTTSNSIFL